MMLKLDAEFHTFDAYTMWEWREEPRYAIVPTDREIVVNEIRGVTWDLDGPELAPWQAAQRLYRSGPRFTDAVSLAIMWAVLEAESGGFLRAWHHNVVRDLEGSIAVSKDGLMEVKSTDLGFIQRNIVHSPSVLLPIEGDQSQLFVNDLFDAFPRLANGQGSADIAHDLFVQRGFQPWYAHSNGSYKRSLNRAGLAVGNYLDMRLYGANGKRLIQRPE